jgi:hypothetical protein
VGVTRINGRQLKLFRFTSRELRVDFCDRCGSVCDNSCRAEAVREQTRLRVLKNGWRVV